jgi:hypothetical protein
MACIKPFTLLSSQSVLLPYQAIPADCNALRKAGFALFGLYRPGRQLHMAGLIVNRP